MLSQLLHGFSLLGEEWVLWILIAMSVLSIAVMIERLVFFLGNRLPGAEELERRLAAGDADYARTAVQGRRGLEAAVVREALNASDRGSESVDEAISATMTREKLRYDSHL